MQSVQSLISTLISNKKIKTLCGRKASITDSRAFNLLDRGAQEKFLNDKLEGTESQDAIQESQHAGIQRIKREMFWFYFGAFVLSWKGFHSWKAETCFDSG